MGTGSVAQQIGWKAGISVLKKRGSKAALAGHISPDRVCIRKQSLVVPLDRLGALQTARIGEMNFVGRRTSIVVEHDGRSSRVLATLRPVVQYATVLPARRAGIAEVPLSLVGRNYIGIQCHLSKCCESAVVPYRTHVLSLKVVTAAEQLKGETRGLVAAGDVEQM